MRPHPALLALLVLSACDRGDGFMTDTASAPPPPLPEAEQGTPAVRQTAGFGTAAAAGDDLAWRYTPGTERGDLVLASGGAADPELRLTCAGDGLMQIAFAAPAGDSSAARSFTLFSGDVAAEFQGQTLSAGSTGASAQVTAGTTGRDPVILEFGRTGRLRLQEGGRTLEADAAPAEADTVARFFRECP